MKHRTLLSICSLVLLMVASLMPSAALASSVENWNPARQGTDSAEDCAGDESLGVDPNEAIIHWIFTSSDSSNAVLTVIVNGVATNYGPVKVSGNATHFVTPFVADFDDIDNAYVTYDGEGGTNVGLRISHWCSGPDIEERELPPPTIDKTAAGQYTKTWTWNVEKKRTSASPVEVKPGASTVVTYEIKVTHSAADISAIRVRGVITVHNPAERSVDITVSDKLSTGLDCDILDDATVTIAAGDTLKFPYRCVLAGVPEDPIDNTGKVAWDAIDVTVGNIHFTLPAGDRTATVAVGAFDVKRVDDCVLLDDTNAAGPQDVKICIGDENSEPTFTYSRTITPEANGCDTYPNTATITTNDTGTTDEDSANVTVCRFAERHSPGYWKNHITEGNPTTLSLLPISLGNYVVSTGAQVTAIFNAMNCSAPVNCLAAHLLAVELDLASGSNPCITSVVADADAFLVARSYAGVGTYVLTAAQKTAALALQSSLSTYISGGTCI